MSYFVSVDTGGTVELGFGSGTAAQHTAIEGYLMTERGLRRLGSGALVSEEGKTPSVALSLEVVVASDPMGLIGGAVELGGEASASTTIERFGKRTAKAIAERLRVQFQKRGWVHSSGTESAVPFNTRAQRERRAVVLEDPVQRLRATVRLPDGAARVSVTDDFSETPSGLKRTAAREALPSPSAAPATFQKALRPCER
jgi:hypothetical protein